MAYTVFARKYRPQTFKDLIGQEHVTRTLGNAIASDRVAHAFLFTGVRGVGKTTSARILAKSLNCIEGPTAEPCNVCDACKEITAGMDLDVIEMDGASNRGVDDIRRLQESIPFRPSRDRYKVVIVDEVHMLTTEAFNAFLKTLEEPPPHVKFIFATTEAHKVPVTIRSRCQRYDFRLIPQTLIAEHVRTVLKQEGVEADDAATAIVAREAAGSMRDALTLLDQIVAFGGEKLTGSEVARNLGLADRESLHALARAVLEGDAAAALETIDGAASQGADLLHFTKQWLDLLRDMVVLRVAGDHPKLVDLAPEERSAAETIANAAEPLELQRTFSGVAQLVDDVGRSASPRAVLEMGAVRLATRPSLRPLSELMARLEALERGGSAGPAPRGPGGGPRGGGRGGPREQASVPPPQVARSVPPKRSASAPATHAQAGAQSAASQPPPHPAASAPPFAGGPPSAAPPAVAPSQAPPAAGPSAPPPATTPSPVPPNFADAPHPADAPGGSRPPNSAPAPARPAAARPAGPAKAAPQAAGGEQWQRMVAYLREDQPEWSAMFEHGVPRELTAQRLVLVFPEGSFYGRQAMRPEAAEALKLAAKNTLGFEPRVEVAFANQVSGTLAQKQAAETDERTKSLKEAALNHPRVQEAIKVFPQVASKVEVQVDPE